MWSGVRRFPAIVLALVSSTAYCSGCGGGGGGSGIQPPPSQPDFLLALSVSSLSVKQGEISSAVSVTVTSEHGFSEAVEITLSSLPSGVSTNPASPFSVSPGQPVAVLFGADSGAATGQFAISAQATSGTLSHAVSLSLTIQPGPLLNAPKSAFVRNDSVNSVDAPADESHRRHVVYDAVGKRFFVANGAMNRVDVLSTASTAVLTSIDVPGASSVDLSPDGATLWVGSTVEYAFAVSTRNLQVTQRYAVAGLTPIPGAVFNRPTELVPMASGKLLVRLRQAAAAQSLLALWDAVANAFSNLTNKAPAAFQNGVGVIARSGDHNRALVASNDGSGELALFDGNGNVLAGPQAPVEGNIAFAAVNNDASRSAVVISSGSNMQVWLLDDNLLSLASYVTSAAAGLVFSRDAQTLYVNEALGDGRVVTALSASNLQVLGQLPDLVIQGVPSLLEDIDESLFLAALSNRGVTFLDASKFSTLTAPAPIFAGVPIAQPAAGSSAGGATVTLTGTNFPSSAQVRFGMQNPVSATGVSNSQLRVASTASTSMGPVNLTAYFANDWLALAPSAFSYGPSIAQILPNTGAKSGGDAMYIYGYGFGSDASKVAVTVGGQAATVKNVDALPASSAGLSLDSTYPVPLERITLYAPAGSPGPADVTVTAPAGSTMLSRSFQFLASSQTYANSGLHKFILYDASRQEVFLTATDHVDVFDLQSRVFRTPIQPPPNGPPPNAALRGLALTPDHTQLVVADFGAQSLYLINPDGAVANGAKVGVGGVAGYLNSGPARVAATSARTIFVGLSGEGSSTGACNACLGQLNITAGPPIYQPAPQPEVSSLTGGPLLQADASGDTVYLTFSSAPGGLVASWSALTPNDFTVSSANDLGHDLAVSSDGTMFAMRAGNQTEIRDADLSFVAAPNSAELESIMQRVAVPGLTLHPTGALVYEPFLDGPPPSTPPATGIGGIDIRDAHNGRLRLRIFLPEPFAMLSSDVDGLHGSFLTIQPRINKGTY